MLPLNMVTVLAWLALGQAGGWKVETHALESWLDEGQRVVVFASANEPEALDVARQLAEALRGSRRVTLTAPVEVRADGESVDEASLVARGAVVNADTLLIVRARVAEPGTVALTVVPPPGAEPTLLIVARGRRLPVRERADTPLASQHLTWRGRSAATFLARRYEGSDFYRAVGHDELAAAYTRNAVIKGVLVGAGLAVLLVGVITAGFSFSDPCAEYAASGGYAQWNSGCYAYDTRPGIAGVVMALAGVASTTVGALLNVHPARDSQQRALVEQHNAIADRAAQ
jgi:hypothetical protein